MNPFLMLTLSVISETAGDVCMKLSDGFKHKLPAAGIVVFYSLAFVLLSQAFVDIPIGIAYAIWTGAAIALSAIVGHLIWHEGFNVKKVAGIALIIGGVALLRVGAM
ncbi:MAG: multidrug efflux SMR transporter [Coriobacteriia bacterium]|nr:multidrug efflux SMR transporter [Coriobacteriia bacterium]